MKVHFYSRWISALFACTMALLLTIPAMGQDYGIGVTRIIPQAPDTIAIDGEYEADIWDTGALFDLTAESNFWDENFPADIEEAVARVLYKTDTLFVFVTVTESEIFTASEDIVWQSDQIIIGIDPVHEAGVTDVLEETGDDGWHGWPENAPDQGPYAYKIYPAGDGGAVTLNWGFAGIDPAAEGWVDAVVWTDEENSTWGVEAAFYVPTVESGARIGFNIGGAQASEAACTESEIEECAYGYYSTWSVVDPGSDIMARTASYGTLQLGTGGGEGYGGGLTLNVPRVDPGVIVIDGVADEAAWEDAQTNIDIVANFNSYGPVGDALEGPDISGETKLLWTEDTLYVSVHLFDVELFWGEGDNWSSDMILIGIDNSAQGDSLFGPSFDGGIENAPEGPYTYFVNEPAGFTIGWNSLPQDTNWVRGVVFIDEELLEWGIEAAIYVPAIAQGAQIGFDIGGAQASVDQCEEGYCDYAYFAWQSGTGGTDPGAINRDAGQWALLNMVLATAIDRSPEVPGSFALEQNFPNPFNPSTTIEFGLKQAGHVNVSVFNTLGQRVATLVEGVQPAGTYRVEWDAANIPSGMYLYRLEVDGHVVQARKMLLLK